MTFLRNDRETENILSEKWHIGEYVRLSKEDGDKPESDSIQNQKKIIENHLDYLRKQGEDIVSVTVYSDDGYAGGNFNRPDYQRMIADVEAGTINCIVFKDNSRLGRNYPELGKLMEDFFPQMGVRIISVLNNLDSLRSPESYCSAIVSFSNIVNDDYIRQLSIKIKSTLNMKRRSGEFIGNYAPYGYVKSAEDRHKLVIDPEAASVVHMIFDWYTGGASASGIVKRLNAMHIPTPSDYKTSRGCKGFRIHSSGGIKTGAWAVTSVNTMLQDEVYIGNLVQGKFKSVSYRSKKMVANEQSKWIVVEGTHEAIISDEQFTLVHDRFTRHTRVPPQKEETYLLSGMIFCGNCGRRLTRCISNGHPRWRCPTRTYAPGKCQCPSLAENKLYAIVLLAIQGQVDKLVIARDAINAARKGGSESSPATEYVVALKRAEREKKRLSDAKFQLYDNFQSGIINRGEYSQFRIHYQKKIDEQDEYIIKLQSNLAKLKEARRSDDEFVEFFSRYGNIKVLDRSVITQLVDRIVIQDAEHIEIYFKFSDIYEKSLNTAKAIEETSGEKQTMCLV
ncbi:putative site-specific recombinase [Oscillibacter valericigenes Sjm18-20]|nr:putative site-specific recombinase [Oscillibacter valericigenes Sjm18-20]